MHGLVVVNIAIADSNQLWSTGDLPDHAGVDIWDR
jgi:hypothetical protein